MYRKFVKIWTVVFEICEQTEKQTNKQTNKQTGSPSKPVPLIPIDSLRKKVKKREDLANQA